MKTSVRTAGGEEQAEADPRRKERKRKRERETEVTGEESLHLGYSYSLLLSLSMRFSEVCFTHQTFGPAVYIHPVASRRQRNEPVPGGKKRNI